MKVYKLWVCLLLTGSMTAAADHHGDKKGHMDGSDAMHHKTRQEQMMQQMQELDMTEEQAASVRTILMESADEMREQRKAMRQETRARMAQVLTPEQMEKMEAMSEKLRDMKRGDMMDSSGGAMMMDSSGDAMMMDSSGEAMMMDSSDDAMMMDSSGEAMMMDSSDDAMMMDSSGEAMMMDSSGEAMMMDSSDDAMMMDDSGSDS